jgi:hypothetical protein
MSLNYLNIYPTYRVVTMICLFKQALKNYVGWSSTRLFFRFLIDYNQVRLYSP